MQEKPVLNAEHQHACGCAHGNDQLLLDRSTHEHPAQASTCQAPIGEQLDTPSPTYTSRGIKSYFRIMQMDCPTEEALLRKKLGQLNEVFDLQFNLIERLLSVEHQLNAEPKIIQAIRSLGMEPETADQAQSNVKKSQLSVVWKMSLALFFALLAEVFHWFALPTFFTAGLALMAICLSGVETYRKGWIALKNRLINMNALMSVAVTGACLLQQWPEAAMVMALFNLAEWIEMKSLDRARSAIKSLADLAPKTVLAQQIDGQWQQQDLQTIQLGQIVRVRPGERLGLDGVVVHGISTVNQASMTGESLPVEKLIGDTVFAGTLNQQGTLDYRVTAQAKESAFMRIIQSIETAQAQKAPTQRFVDRFAAVYTPFVLGLAMLIAIVPPLIDGQWQMWIYRALIVLVIACPCALVLSTPITVVSGLAAAMRKGIFIKGGVYLERGYRLACLALDKTGTLTQGTLALTDFVLINHETCEKTLKNQIGLLARLSDHPVSQAIARAFAIQNEGLVTNFEAILGQGVKGVIDGQAYWLGNVRLMKQLGLAATEWGAQRLKLEKKGQTVVMFADDRGVLACIAVADQVKVTAQQAIAQLHQRGVQTVMLTGDNPFSAQSIANQVGVTNVHAQLFPQDKLEKIRELEQMHTVVGMVGDGMNDAPALARADIGFVMGAMGNDTALETADVALMDDDLRKIPTFIDLSKSLCHILLQNITFTLLIKVVFLILTFVGLGTMWMAVFADAGTSLLVALNGMRLLKQAKST